MKIAVCGHWQCDDVADLYDKMRERGQNLDGDGCEDQRSRLFEVTPVASAFGAHKALAEGIAAVIPDAQVVSIICGQGRDFPASVDLGQDSPLRVLSIDRGASSAWDVGRAVSSWLDRGDEVILEGGHGDAVDLWGSFLEGALDVPEGSLFPCDLDEESLGEALSRACDSVQQKWAGRSLIFAASSQRPLVGLSSVMAVCPDLSVRVDSSPLRAHSVRTALTRSYRQMRVDVPLLGEQTFEPALVPGSGCGGGIAAVVSAVGGAIRQTGEVLSARLDLQTRLGTCDLVVVTEPYLHSPILAEACLDVVTEAAAAHGVPVVAVAVDSSLSRHELAQWGVHGQLLSANSSEALINVGSRLAHTWLRRLKK